MPADPLGQSHCVAGMQDIGHPWANHSNIFLSEITLSEYMRLRPGSVLTCRLVVFSLSTGALVGALFHVLYVRRGDHRFRIRQCGKLLWKENVPELALIWGVVFPETVLYYLDRSADCESSSHSELVTLTDGVVRSLAPFCACSSHLIYSLV